MGEKLKISNLQQKKIIDDIYCPIIHGGLKLRFSNGKLLGNHCCLHYGNQKEFDNNNIWEDKELKLVRKNNLNGIWDPSCWICKSNEISNIPSFRTGMIEKFGIKTNLTGPLRLDLTISDNCNLACRTCGPHLSTFWQKFLKDNNIPILSDENIGINNASKIIKILDNLNLSNLKMVVYSGGETLLGNEYWEVTKYLVDSVPNANKNLTIVFQTNGTMPIKEKYFEIIEKCHLVKLNISIDSIGDKFEYLRWPAKWDQLVNNIQNFKNFLPFNVMFSFVETISIFNLFYRDEMTQWINKNFSTNKFGDVVNQNSHLAGGIFSLKNLTYEYIDGLKNTQLTNLIPENFKESPEEIKSMIDTINKFDKIRGEDWTRTFPEVAEFYKRYL